MRQSRLSILLVSTLGLTVFSGFVSVIVARRRHEPQAELSVTFGDNGVQRLVYGQDVLEDLDSDPKDAFHIWHMKMTDLNGKLISSGQYGWGENNNGREWNPSTRTWTYTFSWGSIKTQFVQVGSRLDVHVIEKNLSNSGVVFDGATIYPLALHFPRLPARFVDKSYPQLAFNTLEPSVTTADYDSGDVVAVVPDPSKWLYSGFWPAGDGGTYFPIISSTSPDGLATFEPHEDRPVAPGQTDEFTVSLRFAPSGSSPAAVAEDAYLNWANAFPPKLKWMDRRPIGTVYLASSPAGNANLAGGYPNNPRRYFNDSTAGDFDIHTAAGLKAFQQRVLQQAVSNVTNMRRMNAQGAITWDLEGEQFPQNTSYVCEPDNIAQIAPEMESIVSLEDSPYNGTKLDDAYFRIMTEAGFRVGVCVRPQHFVLQTGGRAEQLSLETPAAEAELLRKMRYAHDRWGATIFYVDSSVGRDATALDADSFRRLAQSLPDCLIIPEESTPKYYAYTAPFRTFMAHGDLGTDRSVHAYYPLAFSANLINDADPVELAAEFNHLTASVKSGDILLAHVDYWQANNSTVLAIYKAASSSQLADGSSHE